LFEFLAQNTFGLMKNLLSDTAGGTANWSSRRNSYNGSEWINPNWTAPFTMPTPIPGNTMHLITVMPTMSGSPFPSPFKPEPQQHQHIHGVLTSHSYEYVKWPMKFGHSFLSYVFRSIDWHISNTNTCTTNINEVSNSKSIFFNKWLF